MYNGMEGEVTIFDFDEVSDHLLEQGLQNSPSELHGCLCGLLAAGAAGQPEVGLDGLGQVLNIAVHGELADQILQLYAVSAAALEDEEFDFHPLLPDDEQGLAERTSALAQWSSGFLAGFAHESARVDRLRSTLSADSGEILKDFAAIAQADVDEDADEDEEASESSYMELVEYIRFAALNVYMDSRSGEVSGDLPDDQGQPLH